MEDSYALSIIFWNWQKENAVYLTAAVCTVLYETSGCALVVHCTYEKGHKFHWATSCQINNNNGDKLHEDNLLFAMVVVLSGNNYSKL